MEGNACDQLRAQPWIVGEIGSPPMNLDDVAVRRNVNSDGCGVRGTYWGRIVSGCGGPIRTEYTIIEHPVPQRIDPLSCLNLMFSGANPTN